MGPVHQITDPDEGFGGMIPLHDHAIHSYNLGLRKGWCSHPRYSSSAWSRTLLPPVSAPASPSQPDVPTPATAPAHAWSPPPTWVSSVSVPASPAAARGPPTTWTSPVSVPASPASCPPAPDVSAPVPVPYCVSLLLRLILASREISSKVALSCIYGASRRHHESLLPPPPS